MKFSILIANYNNGKYFGDCYHSIISQTYPDWEAIIVDDCSTDDSLVQISLLIANDDRFKLVTNAKNEGCGFTKRRCADLAMGEICGFVDPDDTISSNAIELMVNAHNKHTDVALIHSNFCYCNEKMDMLYIFSKGKHVQVNEKLFVERSNVSKIGSFE